MQGEEKNVKSKGQVGGIASMPPNFQPYLYFDEINPSQFHVYIMVYLPQGWSLAHSNGQGIAPSQLGFYTTVKNRYVVEVQQTGGPGGPQYLFINEYMGNVGFSEVVVKDKGTGQEKGKTIVHNGSMPHGRDKAV